MSSRLWLAAAFIVAFGPQPAQAGRALDVIAVNPDQAKIVNLPPGTATLVIGNPTFADATLMKNNKQAIITAHAYGETNMIALGADGAVLEEKELRVLPAKSVVVLQNGTSRVSYACNPDCMPTVQLGDDTDVFNKAGTQITTRNGLAQGTVSASMSGAGK
jgi:hypothetical protein